MSRLISRREMLRVLAALALTTRAAPTAELSEPSIEIDSGVLEVPYTMITQGETTVAIHVHVSKEMWRTLNELIGDGTLSVEVS